MSPLMSVLDGGTTLRVRARAPSNHNKTLCILYIFMSSPVLSERSCFDPPGTFQNVPHIRVPGWPCVPDTG